MIANRIKIVKTLAGAAARESAKEVPFASQDSRILAITVSTIMNVILGVVIVTLIIWS